MEANNAAQKNSDKKLDYTSVIRRFINFGSSDFGDKDERKNLTSAMSDEMSPNIETEEKSPFPENEAGSETEKFFVTKNDKQKELLDFAKNHPKLNQQIQREVLEVMQKAYAETDIKNPKTPFYEENIFVEKISGVSDDDSLGNLGAEQKELYKTKTGKDNDTNFSFYKKEHEELLNPSDGENAAESKEDLNHQREILARNLKSDLEKSLDERYTAWKLNEIDKRRKAYLEELYKKIEQFKNLEENLSPFINEFGMLWDLSKGTFLNCGFEILSQFADLLEKDESLKKLADLIGRQRAETERIEKELRSRTEVRTEYHPRPAYRGQISGIRLSGEITSTLPSELAMSKNPATKIYFAQKFAEKKLLSYSYINKQKESFSETKNEEVEVSKKEKEKKGPAIICVDTSGSMS